MASDALAGPHRSLDEASGNQRGQAHLVERGLPHRNTFCVKIPAVFIGHRTTGLAISVKEFVMDRVAAKLDEGVLDVSGEDISLWILQAGGSVSRSGLRFALAELVEGTPKVQPRLRRVSTGLYAMRGDDI
jgi:hypothetical protein